MRRAFILLFVLLLGLGCLEDRTFEGTRYEQVDSTQSLDLDNDGKIDYAVYNYAPVSIGEASMVVQRQITVSTETTATYTSVTPNLTDVDLLVADQSLEEFSESRKTDDTVCGQAIGLSNVVCADVNSCSKLCSSASLRCRKIASLYEEPLAGSMISYVQANNEMRSLTIEARRMIADLNATRQEERDAFLAKTRSLIARVAAINANPLYTNSELLLCSHSDFGIPYLLEAADKIGTYKTENLAYRYRVVLTVKPTQKSAGELGMETAGISLVDRMPRTAVPDMDQISSVQAFTAAGTSQYAMVNWTSPKPSKEGYLFYYEFMSSEPPENIVNVLKTPDMNVKRINLVVLAPTSQVFVTLLGVIKNYYIAYGAAVGLTISAVLLFYTLIVLGITIISEKAAGASLTTGFRKAFGRTDVRWKTDVVLAAVFLAAGFIVASVQAVQPTSPPPMVESLEFLLKNDWGIVGIALTTLGVVMAYFAVENLSKITILEKVYGIVIRQEKDMFLAKAASLKDRVKELEALLEEYSKEDFDVSKEYDLLALVKGEKVETLTREMTARTKALVDEYLNKVEGSVNSLRERKRIADENWPKWKENIGKMLDEQEEVYTSSLVTVPASLRAWALHRYMKEAGPEGLSFERDALKKKKIAPDQLLGDLISRNVLKGAVVIKQDKVILNQFGEGSATVMTALSLKLYGYLRSLAKNLNQHDPSSFVAIGGTSIIVMLKGRSTESVLFISKDKFKEAIEQWRAKMRTFD